MGGMDSWQIQLKGLGKKEGGDVFEDGGGGGVGGGWYPNAHYELGNNFKYDFNFLMPMNSLLISNKKSTILQLIAY